MGRLNTEVASLKGPMSGTIQLRSQRRSKAAAALTAVRSQAAELFPLAGPVVLVEVGWMSMGLVDTIMVGPLGPGAIGAAGLGSMLFLAVAIFGMGVLLGLDTLVSQSYGAGRVDECRRWLVHGVVLGLVLAVPMMAGFHGLISQLHRLGLHPEVQTLTLPYLEVVSWSLVPLLCYAAARRFLQSMSAVGPITFALISANFVNVVANWTFIYGHFGLPALGVTGAAWATVVSRIYMVSILALAILRRDRGRLAAAWMPAARIEIPRLRRLLTLGLPAAAQVTLEMGVFAAATALAGRLEPAALAAHQIALNVASLVFMVPLGVSSAGAVLVGQAVGRRDAAGASRSGWTALGTIAAFMLLVALAFFLIPRRLIGVFTHDSAVLALGAQLLSVAAVFQLFDGLQVVSTGVLRGVADTRTPMLWNLAGHWVLGLPTGYTLCFILGWGIVGLWLGLSVGLTTVGLVLVAVWARRVRELRASMVEQDEVEGIAPDK